MGRLKLTLRALTSVCLLSSVGCSGFEPVRDDGGTRDDADARVVVVDSNPGGIFSFGMCCKGNAECKSGLCASIAGGVLYCTEHCQRTPDSCPPGFVCGEKSALCEPPDRRASICSSDIQLARAPRLVGQCCGKDDDCASGLCYDNGRAWRFCSRPCTASTPCPTNLGCDNAGTCAPGPNDLCSW
ncbi:MAG: hypothetical protein KC503_42700 [Myxococcales bacterium]|nr:hypothetical protein [Myxococcales bacterium]